MSVRRFKVLAHLDGASEVMVEITPTAGGTDAVITVRPKHQRRKYSGLLSWAALAVANHDAKLLAQSKGIKVPMPRKGRSTPILDAAIKDDKASSFKFAGMSGDVEVKS